jgi:hypothetical protein
VLYVAPGVETEATLLQSAETPSLDYRRFLQGLGWKISLEDHKGFIGGIDKSWTPFARYYNESGLEMIFHDITEMPNDDGDAKNVKKVVYYDLH